jgi:hypothetical protein
MRTITLRLFFVAALIAGFIVPAAAADIVATVHVLPSSTPVHTGVFVQKGDWMQLLPSGKWRGLDQVDFTDYHGHTNVTITGATGTFAALMVQVGDAPPFELPDTVPLQAGRAGEILLWCNVQEWTKGKAEGFLDVQIRKGNDLAAIAQKTQAERQQKVDALAADKETQECLRLVNETRKWAGLRPVAISVERSAGCTLHSQYLALNWGRPEVEGLKAHNEEPALPGFSEAGRRAGGSSVINYVSPTAAVASWVATFYHRVPLLNPDLTEIGIGYTRGGPGWVCALDCSGVNYRARDPAVYVHYPAASQAHIPIAFQVEIPNPLPRTHSGPAGFPVTVSFFKQQKVTQARLVVTDAAGLAVAGTYSDPEHPAIDFDQDGTICLIPDQPLSWGQTYTAHVAALVDGAPVDETWTFTTMSYGGVEGASPVSTILGGLLIGGLVGLLIYWLVSILL